MDRVNIAILAAGLGTRMKSKKAKVLHRAGGLTLIEHVVRSASAIPGRGRAVVVVGHQAAEVRAALENYDVDFAEQKQQLGTGHALEMTRALLEPCAGLLLVLYGDCPLLRAETLARLVETQKEGSQAGTVITTQLDDPAGYGRIVRDGDGNVAAIVEQKAATVEQRRIVEINSGIYCFRAESLWPVLGALKPNPASGEIYLTDAVEALSKAGQTVRPMLVDDATELLGINTRVELAAVDGILRERKARALMFEGVTIEKPETVSIDADVEVGVDTVIEPFVRILGRSTIGEDCRIGTASIVENSRIGDRVQMGPFSMVGTSEIGAGAAIGPYARLRQDNIVAPGALVGNFVELKNTSFGAGSKAMHLAYLGDASIGQGVNVGAGTITCNYDGIQKHRTSVGDGAFIGSNATLVAPVEIGEGSYVAAGSVITERVGADVLALGRARQVQKPGWPSRRRKRTQAGMKGE
jgi:bifunctional UDP-N-acetylglucosamine pyrophosphorylase/glucosamine-1-phosphate N-acetyltransferase